MKTTTQYRTFACCWLSNMVIYVFGMSCSISVQLKLQLYNHTH